MAAPSLDQLVTQVRLESGLRNNQVVTDTQIASFVNEAYLDLRDKLIIRFAYWFRKEVTFTLSGGTDGYVYDLTQLPDFQMAQGLDLVLGNAQYATIDLLPSYAERNSFNGPGPFCGVYGYNGCAGRKYFIDGDRLEVLPAQNASGDYRLVYTPIEVMTFPSPVAEVSIQPSDTVFPSSGFFAINLANLTVTSEMLTGAVTVDYNSPNDIFNGIYAIDPSTPVGAHYLITTTPWPGGSWTGPASGSATVGVPLPGTIYQLPDKLIPWAEYIVLYASIQVRNVREQDVTALSGRFARVEQRVVTMTKQRSEGVKQAPITFNRTGLFNSWGGNRY